MLSLSDIEMRNPIGAGRFGQVFRARVKQTNQLQTNQLVAVKVLSRNSIQETHIRRELQALHQLRHNNIIPLLGWDIGPDKVHIIMPLRQGSLGKLGRLSPDGPIFLSLVLHTLSALKHLASKGLCHRDVKPDNILYDIMRDGSYRFQLADFGLVTTASMAASICGTMTFMAPEMFGPTPRQTPKMDVWSLLVTLLCVLGDIDLKTLNNIPMLHRAVVAAAERRGALAPMARTEPSERASAAEILSHVRGRTQNRTAAAARNAASPPAAQLAAAAAAAPAPAPAVLASPWPQARRRHSAWAQASPQTQQQQQQQQQQPALSSPSLLLGGLSVSDFPTFGSLLQHRLNLLARTPIIPRLGAAPPTQEAYPMPQAASRRGHQIIQPPAPFPPLIPIDDYLQLNEEQRGLPPGGMIAFFFDPSPHPGSPSVCYVQRHLPPATRTLGGR
ncbi:kinase-like domain-containing protein [Diplogelasinospora grovesii]|uniref:Autophagy-related protein 1 n=1 Tax=Diplogelasinospora grovesii TaxID=303347 RepID=A0AAN6N0Z8_9PEZI|nr:kinase-like domain-containing protein [Diplogelasinospora grovesii]